MTDKPYTDMTPEEARAMLERWNQTDIGAFLKAVKAGMPTLSFEDAVPLMDPENWKDMSPSTVLSLPWSSINLAGTRAQTFQARFLVFTVKAIKAYREGATKKFRRNYHASHSLLLWDRRMPKQTSLQYPGGMLPIPPLWENAVREMEDAWLADQNQGGE